MWTKFGNYQGPSLLPIQYNKWQPSWYQTLSQFIYGPAGRHHRCLQSAASFQKWSPRQTPASPASGAPRSRTYRTGQKQHADTHPPSKRRHGRGSAQGHAPRAGAGAARQDDALAPRGAELRDAHSGHHGRAATQPSLLQQGRPPAVALSVARDRRLADAADPRGSVLLRPALARPQRAAGPHAPAHPSRRRGARAGHGRRRLHLRLRPLVPAGLHLRHPHLHAARLHRLLRVPHRAAAAHGLLHERRGAAHDRRRRAGPARLVRPPRRGEQGTVLAWVLPQPRRRRAVRARAAARRAHLQARRGRRPRGDVRAGDGDAAGHGLLRHRVLHRRHDRQPRFPGDREGSAGVRAGGGAVLHGAGVERHPVAVLLPGRRGGHLLRAHAVHGHPHRGIHPGDGGAGRRLPAREVQQREGRGPRALALGPRILLLRRVRPGPGQQEEENGLVRRSPGFVINLYSL